MNGDHVQIGRYEVITRLAVGGMAELFLAREQGIAGLERIVVLKRVLPHLADQPRFIDMFLREARLVARLTHPNVVQIYDLGEDGGTYFIAMEYIHGTTVRELQILSEHVARFPIDAVVSTIIQTLRGLHAAHDVRDLDGKMLGLVHRDISPHNLMCTKDGTVKLLDFGVAKATEEGLEATNSGNLKGKFAYMSPEQARRKDIDRRSDIFGVGIVAWEMLTGERLFKRDDEVEMMKAVLTLNIPSPSQYNPAVPPAIDAVIMRALHRDPDKRWPTAEVMRRALTDAAVAAQLDVGPDPLATWVSQIAGGHLAMRDETLKRALEHSITAADRERLLHATGSHSQSGDGGFDLGRAVKATKDAILHRQKSVDEPAGVSGETVVAKHREVTSSARPAPPKSRSRAQLKLAVIVLGLLSLAVVIGLVMRPKQAEEATVLLGEPISIVWSPTVDPEILRKEIEPLRAYLERQLSRPVLVEVTGSYAESSEKLLRSEVPFALIPPLMYLRTRDKDDRVAPIALKLFDGAAHSDGLILSQGESGFATLKDLEGKRFCFTDKNSTTGRFLPMAYIQKSGFDPAEFIGEVHWSGDHIQAIRDLLADKCDAAAVYSGAFLSADRFGIPVGQLRQVAITGNVPQDPFVAGPLVSESDKEAMSRALFAFDPMKELGVPRLGDTQRITAFQPASDADFQFLREIVEKFEGHE